MGRFMSLLYWWNAQIERLDGNTAASLIGGAAMAIIVTNIVNTSFWVGTLSTMIMLPFVFLVTSVIDQIFDELGDEDNASPVKRKIDNEFHRLDMDE